MAYNSILGIKPKKEKKLEFCKRIVKILDSIDLYYDGNIYYGIDMLNIIFKYSEINNGYFDIDDLLSESDSGYRDIFTLSKIGYSKIDNREISEYEILVNIEIIVNCFHWFKGNSIRDFSNKILSIEKVAILYKSIEQYLLSLGYKVEEVNEILNIVENEIAIDIEEVKEEIIKEEIISFYDYKNENNIEEKKKIIVNILTKLESRREDIKEIFSENISNAIFNYANNINLRHNNCDIKLKSKYKKAVSELTERELIEWYNYIFAFIINIYLKLDVLKSVNISNNYK